MSAPVKAATEVQFGIAWNWQYDLDFVQMLDKACHEAGLNSFLVSHHNLAQVIAEVERDERRFAWFLDRASDEDKHFLKLNELLRARGTQFLNAHHHYLRASDKAEIHRELLACGLQLPTTLILPPHERQPDVDAKLIEAFAKPFVVKPAKGGGGKGVLTGAKHADDVKHVRSSQRDQKFLVQQRIEPQQIGNRRAWFRVYYVCGQVIPCWWDDRTHHYAMFTEADRQAVDVSRLECISRSIAGVAQLDFFSCEVALDRNHRYVLIDYVNTPCDMRLQSKHANAVPDALLRQIIGIIVHHLCIRESHPVSSSA
jgi:hypothetical protein